jgi:hypothetical protein
MITRNAIGTDREKGSKVEMRPTHTQGKFEKLAPT